MLPHQLPVGGKRQAFHCSYCKRDVTLICRVHCAECPEVKLCGDCFSSGVSFNNHVPNHPYRVVDCLDFPVFTKDWSGGEELLLLEGIERFGAGNWGQIKDYIPVPSHGGLGKSLRQVEEHYWELYMGVHGHCLPPKAFNQNGDLVDTLSMLENRDDGLMPVAAGYAQGEPVVRDRPTASSFSSSSSASSSSSSSSSSFSGSSSSSSGGGMGSSGSSEALSQLQSQASQSSQQQQPDKRKGAQGRGGNQRMDREDEIRQRLQALPGADLPGFIPLREDFDVEWANDAESMLAEMEFSPDDHPSERALKLQVIAIYNHRLDERTKRKRFAIDRGLVDFKKQQQQERRRAKEEREVAARLRMVARFQSPEEHEALLDGLIKARRLRHQVALYQHYRRMGVRTVDQARIYEQDRKKRDAEAKAKKQREQAPYLYATGRDAASLITGDSSSRRAGGRMGSEPEGAAGAAEGKVRTGKRAAEEEAAAVAKAPGAELLSPKELELCQTVPMLPAHFLAAKEAMVREAYRNGQLTLEGVRRVVRLEQDKAAELLDFFVKESGGLAKEEE